MAIREKLKYTHIAVGIIEAGWGLATEPDEENRHFELFEYEGCDWIKNFEIEYSL